MQTPNLDRLASEGVCLTQHYSGSPMCAPAFVINHPEKAADIWRDPIYRELSPPRTPMLFNLDDDPYEQNDLAIVYPERVKAMQRELDKWFSHVEAEMSSI